MIFAIGFVCGVVATVIVAFVGGYILMRRDARREREARARDAMNAEPIVITTASGHGLQEGDIVTGDFRGERARFRIQGVTPTTFQIKADEE